MPKGSVLLYVEDEAARDLIARWLADAGDKVCVASCEGDAARALDETMPEVLVTSRTLLASQGLGSLGRLRQRFPAMRLLAFSNGRGDLAPAALRALGCHDVIELPLERHKVLAKVHAA